MPKNKLNAALSEVLNENTILEDPDAGSNAPAFAAANVKKTPLRRMDKPELGDVDGAKSANGAKFACPQCKFETSGKDIPGLDADNAASANCPKCRKAIMALMREEKDTTDQDDEKEISEDISALFVGENLSEAFLKKASVIFEAAVAQKVNIITEQLTTKYATNLANEVKNLQESTETKVDSYLSFVVESWTKEHEVQLADTLRLEAAENFIKGLKNLFEQSAIEIPESKIDVVAKLQEENTLLKEKANKVLKENMDLTESIKSGKKTSILNETFSGLPASTKDKLTILAETVTFSGDEEAYKANLQILKESFGKQSTPGSKLLTEELTNDDVVLSTHSSDKVMDAYVSRIKRAGKSV